MFRLQSQLYKYSRGIKTLAERAYVVIGDYVWTHGDGSTNVTEATITLYTDRETYYLSIPDDKLGSVIDRLVALRDKRKKG